MPITPTYPGVYIEEVPSGVRAITGVATSITAFVGRALRGLEDEPVRIASYGDYERVFGGLWVDSTMSYAVQHYYLNGGADAIIVRVTEATATAATLTLPIGPADLVLEAASKGEWGNNLQATVNYDTRDPGDTNLYNLIIERPSHRPIARMWCSPRRFSMSRSLQILRGSLPPSLNRSPLLYVY